MTKVVFKDKHSTISKLKNSNNVELAYDLNSLTQIKETKYVIDIEGNILPNQDLDILIPCGHCIESIVFDISSLKFQNSGLIQYIAKLSFSNRKNTKIYEFDGERFEIPNEITRFNGRYECHYILQEVIYNGEHNIKEERECFISNAFYINVPKKNQFNPDYNVLEVVENIPSLIKNPMYVNLSNTGTLELNSSNSLGSNLDSYVKYIECSHGPINKLGNTLVAAIFSTNEYSVAIKSITDLDETWRFWIPDVVTHQSNYKWKLRIGLFTMDPNYEDEFIYEWFSEPIDVSIEKNSLEFGDIDVNKPDIHVVKYSNLLSADEKYIQSADGKIIFWKEE